MATDWTPEDVREFVSSMIEGQHQDREERQAWQQAMDAQKLSALAKQPSQVTEAYLGDPWARSDQTVVDAASRLAEGLGGLFGAGDAWSEQVTEVGREVLATRRNQFAATYEDAYQKHRGEIPMEWWVQWNPADIKYFMGDQEGMQDLAAWVNEVQLSAAEDYMHQQNIDNLAKDAWERRQQRGPWDWAVSAARSLLLPGNRPQFGGAPDFRDLKTEEQNRREVAELYWNPLSKYEDRIDARMDVRRRAWEAAIRNYGDGLLREGETIEDKLAEERAEMEAQLAQGVDPYEVLQDKGFIHRGIDGVVGVFPWMMDKADQGIEGALWGIEALSPGHGTYDALRAEHEVEQERIRENMAVLNNAPDEQLIRQTAYRSAREIWDEMPQTNKAEHDRYLLMAGFNPDMAFNFFRADVMEDDTAMQQMADVVEELRAEERQAIEAFEGTDFRASGKLLDIMAAYGRNVPGRLSTYFSLFLTDGDYFDDAIHGRWGELFSELESTSEYYDHTPSAALGIDGSLSGLLLDLGSGIAFDPMTWIFGPRGSVATNKATSFASAEAIARHPITMQFARDTARIARSASAGMAELLHVSSWADSRFVTELLEITGWQSRQIPRGRWRATSGAENAMEVETKFLSSLVDDAQRQGVMSLEVSPLVDDILANGFDEYASITITRGDGVVFVDDGVKRILAAEQAGINHVPVRLNIVDDFAGRPANLTGTSVTEGVVDRLVSAADTSQNRLFNRVKEEERAARILASQEMSDGSILTAHIVPGQKGAVFVHVDKGGVRRAIGGFQGDEIGFKTKYTGGAKDGPVTLADGRTVAEYVIEEAHRLKMNPLDRLAASTGISDAGFSFIKKQAEKLGVTVEFPMAPQPVGQSLDVFMKGRQSRKALKGAGAGDVITRPDQFFPKDVLLGAIDMEALGAATKRAILRGNIPDGANRSAVAVHWNQAIRQAARTNKGTRWVSRYMSPQNTVRRLELTGTRAADRLIETTFRIWGDDVVKADMWQTRIMEFQRKAAHAHREAAERLKLLEPVRHELDELLDRLGGSPYPANKKGPRGVEARRAVRELQAQYDELAKVFDTEYGTIDKLLQEQANTTELAKLVEEMWDDYNRTNIATNPAWAGKIDPETGLVPWEELKKGSLFSKADDALVSEGPRKFLSEDMKAVAEELGIEAETLVKRLSSTLDSAVAVNVPASPLELLLATEKGGAAYTRLSHNIAVKTLRDAAHGLNNAWKIDKVFRPATAVTVSWDELMRDMHVFGVRDGFLRWQRDRALFLRARAAHMAKNFGNPASRRAVRSGSAHLDPVSQKRLQALSDYPTYLKAAERQLHDGNGLGWHDIQPNEAQYLEAAQRWTGGLLQDSGFRAFLRGRTAFREWFAGTDGEKLRTSVALSKDAKGNMHTRLLSGADEAFDGWSKLFEEVILSTANKNGVFDDVLAAFRETAAAIDGAGGIPKELPSFVFDNLGPIRGVKKELGARHPVSAMTETFFDAWFMDPVNYRRGLVAEQVRAAETARLQRLFDSQKMTIVGDAELERMLGLKGISGGTRTGLKDMLYETAFDKGYVPQGYIDDLVERTVEREIDNMLFTWDRSTRLGQQAQGVFPFGRPWADMAGFWGREVMRKPMLRGQINQKNLLGMRTMYDKFGHLIPFNPKPLAMMSRLAHTDFTIDKGLHPDLPGVFGEGGLLPGADETDFSPLFFLPTGGDNPFGAILPGIGYVPMWGIDMLLQNLADPIDDPERYQELVDIVGDFVPSVKYTAGTGIVPRLLGGGTVGSTISLAVDAATFVNHEPYFFATNMLGDISRELDRTRELSAMLAQPEELQRLLQAETPEDVETLLLALSHEADNNVASSHALETVSRMVFPASNQYETNLHEIFDVWVEAADKFPELAVRPSLANVDLEDPDLRRQYANDVRKAFFDLPSWQRDLFISQQPSLAVNLVGSWDWTPSAVQAGLDGTETVYRSSSTPEGRALHQAYVDAGYIRPVVPIERAKRIIGLMQASKESVAKKIYEYTAEQVNDAIWEQAVGEDSRRIIDAFLADPKFREEFAVEDARDLWNNWWSMEERMEEYYAKQQGVDPIKGTEDYDRIRELIRIPADEKPWGRSWPGLDDAELSQQFQNVKFNYFTPEVNQIAAGLGIDLTSGMTGLQLFNEVQDVITDVDSPLFSTVRPAYDHYISERGVGARAAEAELAKAKQNPDLAEGWRDDLANWQLRADRLGDQYRDEVGGVPLSKAREMAQEFGNLWATSNLPIAWQDIWDNKYARTYGPLEWEPPQPLSPFEEDGGLRTGVTKPYIRYIPDGDTIVFKERRGAQENRTVRLLGVNARDYGLDNDGAADDKKRLQDALTKAVQDGATIYLVRDPLFGDTDHYGRMLAWLYIDDEPFYFEDEFRSTVTPSEADR